MTIVFDHVSGTVGEQVDTLVYWCPDCGRIKDACDEDRYGGQHSAGESRVRWCHAYRAHDGGKRKMRPLYVKTPALGQDDPR